MPHVPPRTAWPLMLLLATAAASTAQLGREADEVRRANLAAQPPGAAASAASNGFAPTRAAPADPAIAAALAQWTALQQSDALPFDNYAAFLLAHPGWPGETANRRAAERQAGIAAPASVIAFFARYPPRSATGRVAYARALAATGRTGEAAEQARAAWRTAGLGPQDEAYVRLTFAGALSQADQDARMDALLWAGATTSAQRQLALVSPGSRDLFAARLSFRTNAADAATLSGTTADLYARDAGYVADRATWLRNNGASPTARAWLARPRVLTAPPSDPENWLETLFVNARGAAADGQWQLAYDIARQIDDAYPAGTDIAARSYGERDQYTNNAWIAAQMALKRLGRPAARRRRRDKPPRRARCSRARRAFATNITVSSPPSAPASRSPRRRRCPTHRSPPRCARRSCGARSSARRS